MDFEQTELSDNVLDALYDMNFQTCTPIQEQCIPQILNHRDVLGVAQTGTGKTAAYLLPILSMLDTGDYPDKAINCVIMSPTRELAQQIDQAMQGFAYYLDGVSSVAVYGGNDGNRYDQELKSLQLGADVVIATPGRFISHISLGNVDLSKVSFFVLDEADRMLDMGFSEDIMTIAKQLPATCQTIMFSATMPPKIESLAKTLLKNPVEVKLAVSKPAEKIQQSAYICHETQKLAIITNIFKAGDLKRVIIFAGSKMKCKQIAAALQRNKINCGEMHSDLDQAQRDEMMFRFKSGQIDVLVATDILARGIDIDDIQMVINYDVPHDAEDYVHRIGRTARAERDGVALTFVSDDDIYYFKQIETFLEKEITKNPLPEGIGDGPDYNAQGGKTKQKAKSRRRKDRDQQSHKHKPRRNAQQQPSAENKGEGEQKPKQEKRRPAKPRKTEENAASTEQQPSENKKGRNRRQSAKPEQKEHKPKAAPAEPKQEKENKPKANTQKKRKNNNGRKKNTRTDDGVMPKKSSKYAIREDEELPTKKESGLKALVRKPLLWLRNLGKH